ncbi:hypothetical protein DL89DRAFT_269862, partial [Linderina pennispora]
DEGTIISKKYSTTLYSHILWFCLASITPLAHFLIKSVRESLDRIPSLYQDIFEQLVG